MSRDTAIFVSQLPRNYPHRGVILKEEKKPSLVKERQFGRHFRRQFRRGLLRVKNCLETLGRQFVLQDIRMSRRALWGRGPGKTAKRCLFCPDWRFGRVPPLLSPRLDFQEDCQQFTAEWNRNNLQHTVRTEIITIEIPDRLKCNCKCNFCKINSSWNSEMQP